MSKIKVCSPFFNNGMSYKVLSQETYKKMVRKGKLDGGIDMDFLRHVGEFPSGEVKTLKDKFGEDYVERKLFVGSSVRRLPEAPAFDDVFVPDKYIAGDQLAFRMDIRGLANTHYWDKQTYNSPDFGPNIFQRVCRYICDIFNPPKNC